MMKLGKTLCSMFCRFFGHDRAQSTIGQARLVPEELTNRDVTVM